ncbi:hypothetical protein CSV86_031010 [Pseudomonas putida CSV86]|uniref:Uncharacterized protein n=1 Tax=Pseudomonas bharatica CSV86 TaxID=1005395 RepID=L1M2U7_9PSED|nr:YbaY family lipoprotein [Pseudomonas bharatica]NNJ19211.1 hypothetical protein [Pseudomonas bharatica CSV86]
MSFRALAVLGFATLLTACSSETPKPVPPQAPAKPVARHVHVPTPLPAYQRELSGSFTNIPRGAEVEVALLVIDERGRPQRLLASDTYDGTGQALPFQLRFNPEVFPAGGRVELRARASQSGQLILHLKPVSVPHAETQAFGPLQLEKAP